MSSMSYEQSGVSYDVLDRFKRACQQAAATTTMHAQGQPGLRPGVGVGPDTSSACASRKVCSMAARSVVLPLTSVDNTATLVSPPSPSKSLIGIVFVMSLSY